MVWRLIVISWALAAVSIAVYFAGFAPEPEPEPAPEPAPVVVAEPPAPAKPTPPRPQATSGPLYVVVNGSHLARLDASGWASFDAQRLMLGLQRDPDGAPWVTTLAASFLRLADAGMKPVATLSREDGGELFCEAFVPIAADQLWTVCGDDVHRLRGETWTTDSAPHERPGIAGDIPVGLSLDGAGRLWLARRMRLEARRELGGWFDVDVPEGDEPVALAPGPGGSMYVLTRYALLRYGEDLRRPTEIRLPTEGPHAHEKLAVSDRGNIVVLTHESLDLAYTQEMLGAAPLSSTRDWVALTRTTDGAAGRFSDAHDVGLGPPDALAIDDRGRVTWASRAGVAILGDGPARRWWRGTVPALLPTSGPDRGLLSGVLVLAGGPEPLPVVDEATPNQVRGRVVERGRARAGVAVELCRTPRHRYRRSPCQDQRLHFAATSDANGGFTLKDVPPGEYELVVQAGERWSHADTFVVVPRISSRPQQLTTIDLHALPR